MKAPLLLLHGALGSASQFSELEKLLENDFEVFKIDFSGHGKNELHPASISIELFTTDVLNFMAENNIESVHIFGYSMGGFVALILALQHPEKVKNIFTLATKFNWTKESAETEIKFLNPEKIKEKVPAFATHLHSLHGNKWEKLIQQTAEMMLQLGTANPLSFSELAKIKTKVLLALGDSDKMVAVQETLDAQASLKNSTFHIFQNTPHPWEQVNQKLIVEEMIRFFDEN